MSLRFRHSHLQRQISCNCRNKLTYRNRFRWKSYELWCIAKKYPLDLPFPKLLQCLRVGYFIRTRFICLIFIFVCQDYNIMFSLFAFLYLLFGFTSFFVRAFYLVLDSPPSISIIFCEITFTFRLWFIGLY